MTISGIPRSHLTLFRAARGQRTGRGGDGQEGDSLTLVQRYYRSTFLICIYLHVQSACSKTKMEFLHLLRYRTRASAQAIFELRVDPVIDRRKSRRRHGIGGGARSISVTRVACCCWTLSLDYRQGGICTHTQTVKSTTYNLLSFSFVTQRK